MDEKKLVEAWHEGTKVVLEHKYGYRIEPGEGGMKPSSDKSNSVRRNLDK